MKSTIVNIPEPCKKELRVFGFVMAGAIAGSFGLILPLLLDWTWRIWPWSLASLFFVIGVFAPQGLRPVFRVWSQLGYLIGRITTPLILGLIFFGIVAPIGLVRRAIGKDPLCRRIDPSISTYKTDSQQPDIKHMQRPF